MFEVKDYFDMITLVVALIIAILRLHAPDKRSQASITVTFMLQMSIKEVNILIILN